jgi:hypothetical protein
MVEVIKAGGVLPKIELSHFEDGSAQIQNGHHRLMAYWLSGRTHLYSHEYILIESEQRRPRLGKINDLWHRVNNEKSIRCSFGRSSQDERPCF